MTGWVEECMEGGRDDRMSVYVVGLMYCEWLNGRVGEWMGMWVVG